MIKIRKELWFGFSLMALIVMAALYMLLSVPTITNGHIGLLMLSLVVVAIMLGFPTAFTLMGMGMIFALFAYHSAGRRRWRDHADARPDGAARLQGDGQRRADRDPAVRVHGLPGRARQPDREAVQEPAPGDGAGARFAGVATLVTCAVFATATGIVGAVVTLMGLLALPQMLRAGYNVRCRPARSPPAAAWAS